MQQGFAHAHVSIFQLNVLANHTNFEQWLAFARARHQGAPFCQVIALLGCRGNVLRIAKPAQDILRQARPLQLQGHGVNGVSRDQRHHRFHIHITKESNFLAQTIFYGMIGTTDDDIGLDANAAQLAHAVLGWLGLQLTRGGYVGHPGDVQIEGFVASHVFAHLADGFQERQPLDVTHGAAHLHDDHVGVAGFGHGRNAAFDLVGHVGNDLDGAAQVITPPLAADDLRIDLTRGDVAGATQVFINEAFIMAQVQVSLRAIFGDKNLAVLIRRHGAWIYVQIGVQFLNGNGHPATLEQSSQRGRGDAFAQRADNAAGYKDILGHAGFSLPSLSWRPCCTGLHCPRSVSKRKRHGGKSPCLLATMKKPLTV